MTSISAANFKDNASGGIVLPSVYLTKGMAKSWSCVASDGSAIEASLNVSSVTDFQTGTQLIWLTNLFVNPYKISYCSWMGGRENSGSGLSLYYSHMYSSSYGYIEQITGYWTGSTNTIVYVDYIRYQAIFGDLA